MLEEQEEHDNRSDNHIHFDDEFYSAIMDEDLERIEDLSEKHGSNICIQVRRGARGRIFFKGLKILPLHLAACYRQVKSMQSLLSSGADPEVRDQLGRTTLHLVITSWPRIPKTSPKPHSKLQPAAINTMHGNAEACLRLLCEHGVDISAKVEGNREETALHLSVRCAAQSAVQILTSYGANVNAVDKSGMTPLHMAAGTLHKDIIGSLIKQGADINKAVEHTGNTALHLAAVATAMKTTNTLENDNSCISALLEHGAEPNTENKAGLTPVHEVCSMGNKELVDLLLRYGANIDKPSRAGENCLFLFLNHRPNVSNSSLLVKLLSLTSPLTLYNHNGHLPSTLTLPCFFKQREQLLKLSQQPRRLQDICKRHIYLKHVRDEGGELKEMLPERLYDFVFTCWENIHDISFVSEDEQDSLSHIFEGTPS
ncbi:ankyrin repeat domain-containing protein 61-like [Solea solea]|uniref:ankyrin repeat domain-containing protein 61-like n=1 Tax=Solea solea TaxID=90069 RepID=UPI002729BD32|nr:ankyrin repeat domain-containing protein 61-like [Solea solea]